MEDATNKKRKAKWQKVGQCAYKKRREEQQQKDTTEEPSDMRGSTFTDLLTTIQQIQCHLMDTARTVVTAIPSLSRRRFHNIIMSFFICHKNSLVYFIKKHPTFNNKTYRVKKNQLDAQLILRIFRQPLHVSGRIQAHHQEVQPYVYNNWYLLFFLDDCLLSCQDYRYARNMQSCFTKYTEDKLRIKLVFSLNEYIMHYVVSMGSKLHKPF